MSSAALPSASTQASTVENVRPRSLTERLLTANVWFVFLFFYAPIIVLVLFSFNSSRYVSQWEGFSLAWYGKLFENDAIGLALRNSLIVGGVSTVVSTVMGTPIAVGMERFRFRGQMALDSVLYLPIIIPDIAMAVMLLLFFVQAANVLGSLVGAFPRLNNDYSGPCCLQH
ncbi:MAG: hypothetical protein R2932_19135 [Caldilineaceae bacterium]